MFYSENVAANVPLTPGIPGIVFICTELVGTDPVMLSLVRGSQAVFRGPIARGHKITIAAGFDTVKLESTANATVDFYATFEDISITTQDGTLIVNDVAHPVPIVFTDPVAIIIADVNVTNWPALYSVRELLGATLADVAPVAVNDVGVVVVAAGATRREVRIRNVGVNPVALVQADATAYADAAVIIQPGELWIEATAAACGLRAKCAAGLASVLNIQTVAA